MARWLKVRILALCLGACCALPRTPSRNWSAARGRRQLIPVGRSTPRASCGRPADPKRAKVHTELAAAYFQAGNMAVALEETRIALEADPENVQALQRARPGPCPAQGKRQGRGGFPRALKIAPKNPDVNNNYGWFLCDIGQPRQSISTS
jgi:type IV pilus assembly protein PilF